MTKDPDVFSLRLLVTVAEQGSLSAAAKQLGVAQPNASRAMRALERDLGVRLLHRTTAGSDLTVEGQVVVDWARQVVRSTDELVGAAAALHSEQRANLQVWASMTVAEYLMPRWLAEFRVRRPEVAVRLGVANSLEVCDAVLAQKVDLGFIESPDVPSTLSSTRIGADRLVVVVAPAHPWARRRRPLTATELAATPLIVREEGSGTRLTLEQLLREHDPVAPALELGSNAAVKVSVVAGLAPAVLSALAVEDLLRNGQSVEVPVRDLDLARDLYAVWTKARRLAGPPADLARIAVDSLRMP